MRRFLIYSALLVCGATFFASCGKEKIDSKKAICKVFADAPKNITATSSELQGHYEASSGIVKEAGFLFGTKADFNAETLQEKPCGHEDGTFSLNVTGLTAGTEYAYMAYAKVGEKRYLSEKKVFKTSPIATTGITLDKTNVTLNPYLENGVLKGVTLQLTATVHPDNASDKTITWTSSDKAVATVSDKGLVTVQPVDGYAIIMAESGDFNAQCKVTVSPVKISSVSISGGGDLLLRNATTKQLTANISPSNAYYKNTEWRKGSDCPTGTTVSNSGLVTCTKGGVVNVEFLVDGVKKASAAIYAIPGPPSAGVDLGGDVKWATYNLGADSQYDLGLSYQRRHKSPNPDISETGDAATYAWGGKWRMPLYDDLLYLKNNCTWTWSNGGYTVSKNGKSIYFPVKMASSNSWGEAYYWSGSSADGTTNWALHLYHVAPSSNTIDVTNGSGSDWSEIYIRPVLGQ